MKIAFDIDGVLDEAPTFFSQLSKLWNDDIYIITFRDDRQKAIDLLEELDIHYTELILVDLFSEKAKVIKANKIRLFIDDQPEVLQFIPAADSVSDSGCDVCLFRNPGNYDAQTRQWIFSNKTAKFLF